MNGQHECKTCAGLGYVQIRETGQTIPCPKDCAAAQQYRAQNIERLTRLADIPTRYQNASLADIDTLPPTQAAGKAQAYNVARQMVSDLRGMLGMNIENPNWLVLTGAVGTGKTHLGIAMVRGMIERGIAGRYVRLDDLLMQVRATYGGNHGGDAMNVLERYQRVRFLLLDEMQLHRVTDHTREIVEGLLRYRYIYSLPTVITTNQPAGEFDQLWGDRIATVVIPSVWVIMGGQNLREGAVYHG